MPTRERLNEVALKLASIDSPTRIAAYAELRSLSSAITSETLTRIAVALFYFYWHSETPAEEDLTRAQILSFMDEVPLSQQQQLRFTFLESLVKLWESVDKERVQKYLRLLKAFYSKVYAEFHCEKLFKRSMVAWNDFLSTCIIFNSRCKLTSPGGRFGASLHAAHN